MGKTKLLARAGVALVATAGIAISAAPASFAGETAVATPGTALTGSVVGVSTGGVGHVLNANGTYTGQLLGVNSVLIEYACSAQATPDGASTGVDCSVNGQDTLGWVTLPGVASSAAGVASIPISDLVRGVRFCVSARGTYVESIAGPSLVTFHKCT
jgi:hypothetical protein